MCNSPQYAFRSNSEIGAFMKAILAIVLLVGMLNASDVYQMGEKIYKSTCLSCHGVDGNTNPHVSFIVNPRKLTQTILTQEQAYEIIKNGAHAMGAAADIMPSFESVLNEEELRAVAQYIYKKFDPKAEERVDALYEKTDPIAQDKVAGMLKRGKKIFNRNCSWCHGIDGRGNGEATRNPEMSIFPYNLVKSILDEKQMFLYAKHGGEYWGTRKEDMPAWANKYDDYTLKSVIKYIKTELKDTSK